MEGFAFVEKSVYVCGYFTLVGGFTFDGFTSLICYQLLRRLAILVVLYSHLFSIHWAKIYRTAPRLHGSPVAPMSAIMAKANAALSGKLDRAQFVIRGPRNCISRIFFMSDCLSSVWGHSVHSAH